MVVDSNNYKKQKLKIAKIHEHISNQRKDWIEKLSTQISKQHDVVCVEDIDLRSLSQCLHLGKSTMDNGFGIFRSRLQQKLQRCGKEFIVIDKWFPSSKLCHHCGTVNTELKLEDRVWTCCCGKTLNRDVNAAINIRNEGIKLIKTR